MGGAAFRVFRRPIDLPASRLLTGASIHAAISIGPAGLERCFEPGSAERGCGSERLVAKLWRHRTVHTRTARPGNELYPPGGDRADRRGARHRADRRRPVVSRSVLKRHAGYHQWPSSDLKPSRTQNAFALASYEPDFWGKIEATASSARALTTASEFDSDTVAMTLAASVADTYFQILSLR